MSREKSDYVPFGLLSGMVHTVVMDFDPEQRRRVLREFIRTTKLKVGPWESASKVGGGALRKFLAKTSNTMEEKTYRALARGATELLNRPVLWTELTGERMASDRELPQKSDIRNVDQPVQLPQGADMTRDVPVYGTISGAAGGLSMSAERALDWVRRPPRFKERLGTPKDIFAALVEEVSMVPKFAPGDLVFVDPLRPAQIGDYVVAEIQEGPDSPKRAILKRLVARTASGIRLEQFTPPDSFDVTTAQLVNLFRVMTLHDLLGV